MRKSLAVLLAVSTIVFSSSSFSEAFAAPPVTVVNVGEPSQPGLLAKELTDAYASGARHIVINPGIYILPKTDSAALTLNGWSGATVDAYHTTLILTNSGWSHGLWEMDDCKDTSIAGGTVSQDQITSYQGRVVAVSQDASGKSYADWKPDIGYPVPLPGTTKWPGACTNIVDQNSRMLKVGNADGYDQAMTDLGNGAYRITFNGASLNFGVGDWIVGRYGDAPFKVHLVNCTNCTIKDLVMMRNGFANIREERGGGNHILHCTWALGPKPDGATEEPLVTNAADGLHSTEANPGPDIENCDFQGVLLDDCIAIHGYFITVVSGSGNTMVIKSSDSHGVAAGDPLRISDGKGFIQDVNTTTVTDNGNGTSTVSLDRSVDVPAGAKFDAVNRDGQGCKIIHNHIGGTRSRGALIKADNAIIEDNVFTNCGMSAVSLGPEYWWGESNYVHDAVVKGNLFENDGIFGTGGACVWVHGDGAIGNQNIRIENNRFVNDLQCNIQVEWADGVTIVGNRFLGAAPWPSTIEKTSVIAIDNVKNITLTNNSVYRAAGFKSALVDVGANIDTLLNNNRLGITTK